MTRTGRIMGSYGQPAASHRRMCHPPLRFIPFALCGKTRALVQRVRVDAVKGVDGCAVYVEQRARATKGPRSHRKRGRGKQFCTRVRKPSGMPLQPLRHLPSSTIYLTHWEFLRFQGAMPGTGRRAKGGMSCGPGISTAACRKVADVLSIGSGLIREAGEA
jgi:hypothetical protein